MSDIELLRARADLQHRRAQWILTYNAALTGLLSGPRGASCIDTYGSQRMREDARRLADGTWGDHGPTSPDASRP